MRLAQVGVGGQIDRQEDVAPVFILVGQIHAEIAYPRGGGLSAAILAHSLPHSVAGAFPGSIQGNLVGLGAQSGQVARFVGGQGLQLEGGNVLEQLGADMRGSRRQQIVESPLHLA